MPRKPTTYQFDLFSSPQEGKTPQLPHWQALPEGTRLALTRLAGRTETIAATSLVELRHRLAETVAQIDELVGHSGEDDEESPHPPRPE